MLLCICSIIAEILFLLLVLNDVNIFLCILAFILVYPVVVGLIFITNVLYARLFKEDVYITPRKHFGRINILITEFLRQLFRIDFKVKGFDKISDLKGYELICNHQSNFDPLLILDAVKRPDLGFIMKKELKNLKLLGKWLKASGFYFLDRQNNREGLKTIINGVHAIENNRPINLFIEGTRSKGPNMGEFRDGGFKMAMKANSPIVISIIDNTYSIKGRFPFKKTTVVFEVLKVLEYDDYKDLNTFEIATIARNEMEKALTKNRIEYKY